jgi:ankyrin repeat protein
MKKTPIILLMALFVFQYISCGSTPPPDETRFGVDPRYKKQADRDLFFAVKAHDIAAVEEALNKKADPNVSDNMGQSALMWACYYNQIDIVKALMSKKIKPNIKSTNEYGYSALHCAAYQGNAEIFSYLIDSYGNDKDIWAKDDNKEGILHKIAKSGKVKLLEDIIKKWPLAVEQHINEPNIKGQTPLHIAVILGNQEIFDMLLANKADPMKASNDVYPLYSAYKFRRYKIFISLLIYIKNMPIPKGSSVAQELSKIIVPEETTAKITLEDYLENNKEKDDGQSREKYRIALQHLKAGNDNDHIADEDFTKAIVDFYKAIENEQADFETVKEHANDVIDDIGKIYNSDGYGGEPLLITVLTRYKNPDDRFKIIVYLLDKGFQVNSEKNLLCTAAKMAIDDKSYYGILNYLISNTSRYSAAIGGLNGIDRDTGNTTAIYIVQNVDFIKSVGWQYTRNILVKLKDQFPIQNRNNNIISEIITSNSDYRNQMFEFVIQEFYLANTSYRIGSILRKTVLHYAYEHKYWYGIDYLVKDKDIDIEVPDDETGKSLIERIDDALAAPDIDSNPSKTAMSNIYDTIRKKIEAKNAPTINININIPLPNNNSTRSKQ